MTQFEKMRRGARQDVVDGLLEARATRAELIRAELLRQLRPLRTMTVAQERAGMHFSTAEGLESRLTVTMSVREARALIAVTGPIGKLNGDGPTVRLLCAIGIVQRHLLHVRDVAGPGRRAALMVLRVAVDDCIAGCDGLPRLDRVTRSDKGRRRSKLNVVAPAT